MTGQLNLEDLRLLIYQSFATDGRAPDIEALVRLLDTEPVQVTAGLRELARGRHLVLDDQDRILMAHPFAAVPSASRSWEHTPCGGVAAPGIPSRSPI